MASSDLPHREVLPLYGMLVLAVFLSVALWLPTHHMHVRWPNVPPAPTVALAPIMGLGDTQLAYRNMSMQLQQMGSTGGDYQPFKNFDYNRVAEWFFVLDKLDPVSNYVPFVAAYYYSATIDHSQLPPVIHYLRTIGQGPKKWRWHAHAVYLASHVLKDYKLAKELAQELADLPDPSMPLWTRQMPAIVAASSGDNDSAVKLMRSILMDMVNGPPEDVQAAEVNTMLDFICKRLQTPAEAAKDPTCQIQEMPVTLAP